MSKKKWLVIDEEDGAIVNRFATYDEAQNYVEDQNSDVDYGEPEFYVEYEK